MSAERNEQRLAAAYWSLLRAYPADYRRERGEEIVSVLLEGAGPGQRWPTATQALDLIGGGLRRRLGLWRFVAPAGVRVAGGAALALAAGLSLFWLTGYELHGEPMWAHTAPGLGPFESSSPVMYAAWLVTVAVLCLFGRYGRRLTLLSLAITWGMYYIADLFGWTRPADDFRTVLLLLGLVALAAPARPARRQRWAIGCGALGAAAIAWVGGWWASHNAESEYVLHEAKVGAGAAALVVLLVAIGLAVDRRLHASRRSRAASLALIAAPLSLPVFWLTALLT